MVTELETDQDAGPALPGSGGQFVQAVQRVGDWLFQQNVAARLRRRDSDLQVQGGWIGDHHRVRLAGQGCVQVSLDRVPGQFVVGEGALMGAVEKDILLALFN